jgi:hypothetical protein
MLEINLPDVVDEVKAVFEQYETALIANDISTLDQLFWQSSHTIRYGIAENLYGYEEIANFRRLRQPTAMERELRHTTVTTYGQDLATVNTEFHRPGQAGRQSQTWMRTEAGWRVVSAHVSLMPQN